MLCSGVALDRHLGDRVLCRGCCWGVRRACMGGHFTQHGHEYTGTDIPPMAGTAFQSTQDDESLLRLAVFGFCRRSKKKFDGQNDNLRDLCARAFSIGSYR